MSDMIGRVANAIFESSDDGAYNVMSMDDARRLARAAIEAMRPEFEKLSNAYSRQGDDWVWIDDRTPIGQYVDSIINRVDT